MSSDVCCVATRQTRVRSSSAVSVLGQRNRRWAKMRSTLDRRLLFAGYQPILQYYRHSGLIRVL